MAAALPQFAASLERMIREASKRLERLERYQLKTEAFIAPTLAGTWVNFGGTFELAGYCKDPLGFVHMRGTVKNGGVIPSNIFTLPAGYRPPNDIQVAVVSNGVFGYLNITSAGVVSVQVGNQASVNLLCSFRAA